MSNTATTTATTLSADQISLLRDVRATAVAKAEVFPKWGHMANASDDELLASLGKCRSLKTALKRLSALVDALPEPAPEASAEDADEEQADETGLTVGQRMAKQLREARVRYVKSKSASGKASAHNNDGLAQLLAGRDHVAVATLATLVVAQTDEEPFDAFARYSHLNNGQIRMNSGNLIRARLKAGLVSLDAVAKMAATA